MSYQHDEFATAIGYALFSGASSSGAKAAPAAAAPVAKKEAPKKAAADDFDDMFGDEPEEEVAAAPKVKEAMYDEEDGDNEEEKAANRARRARMEAARKLKEDKDAKDGKKQKEKPAERSLVVLEVKPWEADTDLKMVWEKIKEYKQEGLSWGENFKLEPIAYGVKKLVMTCAIVDALVLMDDITENIEGLDEWVQSCQVVSMNKL
jgi:translation elongation factor EF-1beta